MFECVNEEQRPKETEKKGNERKKNIYGILQPHTYTLAHTHNDHWKCNNSSDMLEYNMAHLGFFLQFFSSQMKVTGMRDDTGYSRENLRKCHEKL